MAGDLEVPLTLKPLQSSPPSALPFALTAVSQMTEALNRGRLDPNNRTVRFRVYDYLVSTNKLTGGKEYQRLQDALERLRGTSIKTNIKTGGQRVKEGFGIVDSWKIMTKRPTTTE